MARTLEALGAEVVELPAIRIEPRIDSDEVRAAIESLHTYALVCVTSPNGARLLFEAMADAGRDARALSQAQVAAIGPGTARALRERGVIADVVPGAVRRRGAGRSAGRGAVQGKPVLVARAAEARDVLPDAFASAAPRWTSSRFTKRCARRPPPEEIEAAMAADYVTFTSSSTVKNFLEVTGGAGAGGRADRLDRAGDQRDRARAGIDVDVEAATARSGGAE